MATKEREVADAIRDGLISQELGQAGGMPVSLTDVVYDVSKAARLVAHAISSDAAPGTDAAGGKVACLTEAVMGITAGLFKVAEAISELAEAVRISQHD